MNDDFVLGSHLRKSTACTVPHIFDLFAQAEGIKLQQLQHVVFSLFRAT